MAKGMYKSLGWHDADEKHHATHMLLGMSEYNKILQDIEKAETGERNAVEKYASLKRKYDTLASEDNESLKKKYNALEANYKALENDFNELEKKAVIPNGMVIISEKELNGYKNAVRIVRDRAMQQIDKAKADKHGYTLLRADNRQYDPKHKEKAWLITKSTPYSIRMDTESAYKIIEKDLEEFYYFRELPVINRIRLSKNDLLSCHERYFKDNGDRTKIYKQEIIDTLKWMDETNGKVSFEKSKLSKNAATGCYEISYWATQPV